MNSLSVLSQNLIPNPSFEEKSSCPSNHTTQHEPIKTKNWYSPSTGTPDLFSSCAFRIVSTPKNFVGIAYPPDGQNYVGMFFGSPKQTVKRNYREYLACKLLQDLDEGEEYLFQFYAKPATNSSFIIDRLTFALSSDSINVEHDNILSPLNIYSILVDTVKVSKGWYKVELEFTANGTEKYLTIGDFITPGEGHFEKMFAAKYHLKEGGSTYYLYDHFSLTRKRENLTKYITEKPFSLEKIYFAFDSHILNELAFDELSDLAKYLKIKEELALEIYGNTDTKGSDDYNDNLSILRAESVKNVLEEYGIDPERLKTFGKREIESIYQIDSLNRRTEFILIPKTKSNNSYE